MTDRELRELVANIAVRQEHLFERAERLIEEVSQEGKETDRRMKETDRQLKELGKQIGGLGEKFGGFTEGMAFPSMQKILRQRFGMEVVTARAIGYNNGRTMEVDVMAYANTKVNAVYLVEVKSHLREDGIQQMLKILKEFHGFFPGHADKNVYGILAAVDIPEKIGEKVLKEGLYVATIHDGNFELRVPEGFQPRAF